MPGRHQDERPSPRSRTARVSRPGIDARFRMSPSSSTFFLAPEPGGAHAFPCGPRAWPTTARTPPSAPRQPTGLVLPSLSPLVTCGSELCVRRGHDERPRLPNRILVARTLRRRCGLGYRIAGFDRASARAADARVGCEVLVQSVLLSLVMRGGSASRRATRVVTFQNERHHRRQNGTNDFAPLLLADRGDACSSPRPLRAPIRPSGPGSRTRTGELSRDRSWMDGIAGLLLRMRSAGRVPVDANPRSGNHLAEANRSAESGNRLGRLVSDRPPITVHLFVPRDERMAISKTRACKLVARARSADAARARDAFYPFA